MAFGSGDVQCKRCGDVVPRGADGGFPKGTANPRGGDRVVCKACNSCGNRMHMAKVGLQAFEALPADEVQEFWKSARDKYKGALHQFCEDFRCEAMEFDRRFFF